jgi:hypothetical protein
MIWSTILLYTTRAVACSTWGPIAVLPLSIVVANLPLDGLTTDLCEGFLSILPQTSVLESDPSDSDLVFPFSGV